MANQEIQALLQAGIQAARNGNRAVARNIFEQVLQRDPHNEVALMWMASVLESLSERREVLERVLRLNPSNERARQALAKLKGEERPSAPPRAPEAPAAEPVQTFYTPPPLTRGAAERLPVVKERPRQRQGADPFTVLLVLSVAFILIALAFFLFFQDQDAEEATPTPLVALESPSPAATAPPSATPLPFTVIPAGSVGEGYANLPPSWTPAPTFTATPSMTATPPPPSLANFRLVFSGAENPSTSSVLQTIRGDGTALLRLPISVTQAPAESAESPAPLATLDPTALLTATLPPTATPTLVPAGDGRIALSDPALSPDGRSVAFTAQLSAENQEIFLYNFETQALRQLTRLGARVADGAAWSPDGTQLAFSANPLGRGDGEQINFDLYLYTLADGEVFNLTDGRGSSREPHWSPDGARLVFSSDRATPGELEIFVMALDDLGTAQQLTSATGRSFSPKFSPDGTRIAFISNRGGDNDLYLMMADGTDERLVTVNDGGADDRDPTWSPDGSWLVLSSNRDNSEVLQLWAVSPDGSGWQVLTSGLGSSRYAEFFPE